MTDEKLNHAAMNLVGELQLTKPENYYEVARRLMQKYAASEIEALQMENSELKSKNLAWALGIEQSNTDIVDMQRDEFRRIIALTDDREIKSICERAIACIEQTVPVVVQRDSLHSTVAELERDEERFNWAIDRGYLDALVDDFTGTFDTVRVAIDDAMSAEKK